MRKIDQYRHGMEFCLANAVKAPFNELRAVWQTLGSSYAFLAELEAWPGFGPGNADGLKSPPAGTSAQWPSNSRSYSSRMIR